MDNIRLTYEVEGGDLTQAGEASAQVKQTLRKLGFDPDTIRRVSVCMYEGEINMVIHADGGTATVDALGIKQRLAQEGIALIDRDTAQTPQERQEMLKKALTCGTFLMSSNAISADGQLVNIDGTGNRVAALCFGPEQVIMVAGMNKVAGDLEGAMRRAREVAAPVNAQRFAGLKTPCSVTGLCADCTGPDSICCQIVTTRICRPAGRIKVVLVGEELGF